MDGLLGGVTEETAFTSAAAEPAGVFVTRESLAGVGSVVAGGGGGFAEASAANFFFRSIYVNKHMHHSYSP